jgi:hypothetical protein
MMVVVLNNRQLAMIQVEQMVEEYPNFGTDLINPDFVEYAEAYGAAGIRVDTPEGLATGDGVGRVMPGNVQQTLTPLSHVLGGPGDPSDLRDTAHPPLLCNMLVFAEGMAAEAVPHERDRSVGVAVLLP